MFHSQGLRYLLWALTHYIHRLPCLTYSDYHQTNLFVNERALVGCRGCYGLKINWSLRSIQLKYFILFHFISVHLISLQFIYFYSIFIRISFQIHFNVISIFFQFYFIYLFFCFILLITFSVLYFSIPFCTLLYFI